MSKRGHQIELEMQNEELRSARHALDDAQTRFRELYDFAPVAYLTVSQNGVIESVNHAAARLLGKERHALVGTSLFVLTESPDITTFLGLASSGNNIKCESKMRLGDGTRVDAQLTATRLANNKSHILLVMEDITQRNRTTAALEEDNRKKDEFIAVLSHELRNPLAPIRTGLSVLMQLRDTSSMIGKVLSTMDRQVHHLTNILDDLLDVSRMARGKVSLRAAPRELGEICRQTVDDYQSLFDDAGVLLATSLAHEPLWLEADATRLTQIFGNLLINAVKFTPRGGSVSVTLRRDLNRALLSVTDTGIGVAADLLPHVFTPFAQGPQGSHRGRGGLGLGLAMVKGLVELHGGSVEAHSEGPGRGACFSVHLPLIESPATERVPKRELSSGSKRRVLVVEDNVDAAELLKYWLERRGHDVCLAGDGAIGMRVAEKFHPDIILCDLGMPNVDGFEFARWLRANPFFERAYLVAVSGYTSPRDVRRALAAGFDRHIAKPINDDMLTLVFSDAPSVRTTTH